MAKLSSIHGRRLRPVAVAALVVGTTGAFFSGGHEVHAAGGVFANGSGTICNSGSLSPDPITASSGSESGPGSSTSTFKSGSASVTIDGATLVFSSQSGSSTLTPIQTGSFKPVTSNGCDEFTQTGSDVIFSSTLLTTTGLKCDQFRRVEFAVAGTNDPIQKPGQTTVVLSVYCSDGTTMQVQGVGTINGFGDKNAAATPELGSGELLATGLVPALGIILYRRRRQRRAGK
jgi:hypothetical protein